MIRNKALRAKKKTFIRLAHKVLNYTRSSLEQAQVAPGIMLYDFLNASC